MFGRAKRAVFDVLRCGTPAKAQDSPPSDGAAAAGPVDASPRGVGDAVLGLVRAPCFAARAARAAAGAALLCVGAH